MTERHRDRERALLSDTLGEKKKEGGGNRDRERKNNRVLYFSLEVHCSRATDHLQILQNVPR